MRRKKSQDISEAPDRDLLEHIHGLGLGSVEEYRNWCAHNGFSRKLKKHWRQRCRERFHSQEAVARQRLNQQKREKRNLVEVITGICEGRLGEDDVTQPHLQHLCKALRPDRGPKHELQINRTSLLQLLSHLHRCRAKFFDGSPVITELGEWPGNTFVEALALISAHSGSWRRPIEDWKPRSHSARRQFASLLRHLFVEYDDMPTFFDSVWFAGRTKEAAERQNWYLYVGKGQNIRNCKLPIPFTTKMAHHFTHAPNDLTIEQALRWGQVHGLGGDERLARAIFGTRLIDSFEQGEFWASVIRWFAAHPMLDRAHVGPIIDYLHHQRFEPEHVYVAPGHRKASRPPRPDLTMKGRTPESLLRRVNEWHRKLANDNTHQVRQWEPSGIKGFEFLEGSQKNGNLKCWTIRELLSSKALLVEGRQLKHCVATYASSCARGRCSIWTMEVESLDGHTKAITIEVRNSVRLICQARGKANRLPTEKERGILRRWAEQIGLKTASHV
jgi:PcfJ-like protein